MSEEIIIGGVNVTGCCCYENDKCLWTKRYYENNIVPDCEKVKNCYFKQLKRAEIEIEKLKGVDGSVHPDSAYYKITRLEQENKELKELKCKFKEYCTCDTERLKAENEELKAGNEWLKQSEQEGLEINAELEHYLACMTEQRNKLKLALEEIREIENNHNLTINKRREKINNKISEVLDER